MSHDNLLTWQRIEKYPDSGQMFGANNTVMNTYHSYDRFMHKKVVEYTPLIEQKPLPTISFIRDKIVPYNSTNVNFVNGEIQIDGSLEKTSLYTRQTGRYLPGLYGLAGIGVRIPNMTTGTYEFGYGNDEGNRVGIRVENGEIYTLLQSGGVIKALRPRAEWLDSLDGEGPSGLNVTDLSKIVFRMEIGWYGYLSIEYKLVVSSREKGDQMVTIDTHGLDDVNGVSIQQPDLPIYAEASGGVMYVGGRQYGVYGRYIPEYRFTASPRITKSIPTDAWTPIMSFKIKADQIWSSVPVMFSRLNFELNNTCEYRIILHDEQDLLLTGATFGISDIDGIDQNDTALEIDTAASAIVAGGYKMYSTLATASGNKNETDGGKGNAPDITLPQGLILTIVAQATVTQASATTIAKFTEEF